MWSRAREMQVMRGHGCAAGSDKGRAGPRRVPVGGWISANLTRRTFPGDHDYAHHGGPPAFPNGWSLRFSSSNLVGSSLQFWWPANAQIPKMCVWERADGIPPKSYCQHCDAAVHETQPRLRKSFRRAVAGFELELSDRL